MHNDRLVCEMGVPVGAGTTITVKNKHLFNMLE